MKTVLPGHVFEPFTPEVIDNMDWAFKAAIKAIEAEAGPASDATREMVALTVVDTAQTGLRERDALRDAAVSRWRATKMTPSPCPGSEEPSADLA